MNHTKETMNRQVGLGKTLRNSLYEIERKATKNKKHKFQNLYQLLNSQNLIEAYREINKQATSGIDGQSAKEFGKNLIEEVTQIEEELKTNRYRTSLVKRTYIEKPGGGQRPLGIPTVKDKTIQIVAKNILEAIYEPEFIESSMGYRKNRGAKQAVEYLGKELNFGKYTYIVEADIKGFFDNVNHQWLKRMLEEKVRDNRIITLIEKWLKASIIEPTGEIKKPQKGTPQGGAISPILANIYLHYALDLWFDKIVEQKSKGECKLVRYADDFV
ncbi:reverse transcriptase domain-containing protein [Natranaerovirga hydrolytica]|uniref:reverse transcriptase domain-containing protein n=1 Tax=Natranaerovirga hydrolytica TaxID=680378 RepID=UPI001FA9B9A3|nr:reverse transcriptase domain-containing protein [Natranaerovirga hydrolytica]